MKHTKITPCEPSIKARISGWKVEAYETSRSRFRLWKSRRLWREKIAGKHTFALIKRVRIIVDTRTSCRSYWQGRQRSLESVLMPEIMDDVVRYFVFKQSFFGFPNFLKKVFYLLTQCCNPRKCFGGNPPQTVFMVITFFFFTHIFKNSYASTVDNYLNCLHMRFLPGRYT